MRHVFLFTAVVLAASSPCVAADEKSFDSAGVKIAYLDEGKGEAVVLLHGFTQSATEMWVKSPFTKTPMLPALAKEYRVIAPDLRGHGKSDKPHDPKKYGAEMAEDVIRLLDHLKVKKAHVVGYSMGSSIAGKILVSHPNRVLSVTFGGGAPPFRPSKTFTDTFAAVAESLEQGKGIGPLVVASTPDGEPKPTSEYIAAIDKLLLTGKDQKALAAVLRNQDGLGVTEEQLKANRVPVQFVYGSREVLLLDLIRGSIKVMPKAEVVELEKEDHGSTIGSPKFLAAVQKFLRANTR